MDIKQTTKPLTHYQDTVKEIIRLSDTYWTDLLEFPGFDFKTKSFPEIFRYVKSRPYVSDPKGNEHVSRPMITLNNLTKPFDCDDRSVIIRSAVILKNHLITGDPQARYPIQAKVIVSGRYTRPHHVYIDVTIPGVVKNFPIDPTYPKNEYGKVLFLEGFREEYE